jgi:hypothetical protein
VQLRRLRVPRVSRANPLCQALLVMPPPPLAALALFQSQSPPAQALRRAPSARASRPAKAEPHQSAPRAARAAPRARLAAAGSAPRLTRASLVAKPKRRLVPGMNRSAHLLVQPTGGRLKWTEEEDEELRRAVAENTCEPNHKSQNGILWTQIQRLAPRRYPLLMPHLTTMHSKTLAKRWGQFLCPPELRNTQRTWR